MKKLADAKEDFITMKSQFNLPVSGLDLDGLVVMWKEEVQQFARGIGYSMYDKPVSYRLKVLHVLLRGKQSSDVLS